MKNMMKLSIVSSILVLCSIGCAAQQPYTTIKTNPEVFVSRGPDPKQVEANALKACTDDGFYTYSVIEQEGTTLKVHCEKEPKSFFTQAAEYVQAAKKKYQELKEDDTNK